MKFKRKHKAETRPDIMERMIFAAPTSFPETVQVATADSLREVAWWMYDATCVGLGAERQFDYAQTDEPMYPLGHRLGRCYELAAQAFSGWEMFEQHNSALTRLPDGSMTPRLPAPKTLVHGTWQGPEPVRIGHAWVVLEDGRIWEPITALICDPVLFHAYSRDEAAWAYDATAVRVNLLKSGHYGPWHESDRRRD